MVEYDYDGKMVCCNQANVKFKVTPTLLMLFDLRYRQSYKRKLNFPITLNFNSIYNIEEVPFFEIEATFSYPDIVRKSSLHLP